MVLSDDFYYQPIRLDTINTQIYTDLIAKEGDAGGRGLKVTITENGVTKNTTGITLNLKWEHTAVAGLQGLEPFEAVDLTKGIYKLKYPTNMLHKGTVKALIQIIDNGGLAGSRNLKIKVDSTVGDDTAIESSNEFAALASALVEVQSWNGRIDDVEQDFIDRANNLDATYPTRLVSVETQLAHIESTKAEVDYVDGRIGALGATATFKGSDTNANILAKTGMATGDEWFDITNSSFLRYNGTTWVSVGANTKLGSNSVSRDMLQTGIVTPSETNFATEVRNLVTKINNGTWYGGGNGEKVVTGSNASYAGFVITVMPNAYYSISAGLFSNSFSRVVDANGIVLSPVETYRVAGQSGYVYLMPANARYLYIAGTPLATDQDIVVLQTQTDIASTRYRIADYPFDTVVKAMMPALYSVANGDFADNLFTKIGTVEDYSKITDVGSPNLVDKSALIINSAGSTIKSIDGSGNVVGTIIAAGGGFKTPNFNAFGSNVELHLTGTHNLPNGINVTLRYYDSADVLRSIELQPSITSPFDVTYNFDAGSLAVYNDAKYFAILINTTSASGVLTITDLTIRDLTSFEIMDIYSSDFKVLVSNINNKIAVASGSASSETIMTAPNAKKYVLNVGETGLLSTIPTVPDKVLFVGNSLLLGMDGDGSRGGAFGMCASNPQSDYAYHVSQAILAKNPSATFTKLHGAAFEQCESVGAQDTWWTNTAAASFTSDLDLIILQVSDNVNSTIRQTTFANGLNTLIQRIKTASPNARIIWVEGWFNASRTHTAIADTCDNWGIIDIDIATLNTTENQGYSGQIVTYYDASTIVVPDAYILHPGDLGFERIADRIITQMNM